MSTEYRSGLRQVFVLIALIALCAGASGLGAVFTMAAMDAGTRIFNSRIGTRPIGCSGGFGPCFMRAWPLPPGLFVANVAGAEHALHCRCLDVNLC